MRMVRGVSDGSKTKAFNRKDRKGNAKIAKKYA
jgi:hypothetical protein